MNKTEFGEKCQKCISAFADVTRTFQNITNNTINALTSEDFTFQQKFFEVTKAYKDLAYDIRSLVSFIDEINKNMHFDIDVGQNLLDAVNEKIDKFTQVLLENHELLEYHNDNYLDPGVWGPTISKLDL